jgi:hypothetical protein
MSVILPTATSLLDAFSTEERKKLLSLARKIVLRPGETVERPELDADTVGLVDTGAFIERLYYGARTVPIVRIAGSSELLQTHHLFVSTRFYRCELRAIHIENNSLLLWPVEVFLEALKTNPETMLYLCHFFSHQAHLGHRNLYEAVAHSAYFRLVNLLVGLANQFGYLNANGSEVLLPLKLSIKDLSECINVSRETGSNLFNKLRRKGVIAPGKFIKVELSRLSEYAATLE